MSGSGASNLGYGYINPGSNINTRYVNVSNTHNAGNFGSRVISGMPNLPGLSGAKWNVDAAKGKDPGICVWKGGSRKKIKNITKVYKMKGGKRKRSLKKTGEDIDIVLLVNTVEDMYIIVDVNIVDIAKNLIKEDMLSTKIIYQCQVYIPQVVYYLQVN